MKLIKTLIIGMVAFFAAASLFAAGSYKVERVTGKVTYEANGEWKAVTVGQELVAGTNINTALNSSLVVSDGSSSATIKAMQKGSIESLASATGSKGGLKKATLSKNNVAKKAEGSQSGVATASSRASEAKKDLEWDE
ncbi:hypothetical protein DYE50_07065 [Treponema ruminis]|uniref:Uncharacterized protein n=1 Tax=Treponema ruminis TaxID=744515 RepID=A0A7W8G8G3_9SPIR|nr:hypothetical protein [Treponema ruminis]MBB5225636.1 hypothetical protein [Treponema ruminis]QSI02325.1 hypothetical protein DYE50_07065 [Treponema ruminis]